MPIAEQLSAELDHLSKFDPSPFPVISLYLDLSPSQVGRDQFEPFLRKELADRVRTYQSGGPERESLDRDIERIWTAAADVDKAANSLILFACSGTDLFVSIPTPVRIEGHQLHISDHPHLYPLARLLDRHPAYALLLADTKSARLFVVAVKEVQRVTEIDGVKTKRPCSKPPRMSCTSIKLSRSTSEWRTFSTPMGATVWALSDWRRANRRWTMGKSTNSCSRRLRSCATPPSPNQAAV